MKNFSFMEEIGDEGDVEGVVLDFGEGGEGFEGPVGGLHPGGAAGGAVGIEQVDELLVADGGGHGDIGRVEIGEGLADGAGAGFGELRKISVERCATDLVAICDDDCEPTPEWLSEIARAFAGAPDVGIVAGQIVNRGFAGDARFKVLAARAR